MRGYQKRVIHIKNTGSNLFEEAYFVVKEDSRCNEVGLSIIDEANRIIEENVTGEKRKKKRTANYVNILFFAIGLFVAALCFYIFNI
jgi:hypothetical protein